MYQSSFNEHGSLRGLTRPVQVKPRIFVSFHHGNDRSYADAFGRLFDETYDVVTNRSIEDPIDSDNCDYVYKIIRDHHIKGTSCTIVLCGSETMNRKHVDWEIKATLDMKHALLGLWLPTAPRTDRGIIVPDRLDDNRRTGYAVGYYWDASPMFICAAIGVALDKSKNVHLIDNSRPMMARNR